MQYFADMAGCTADSIKPLEALKKTLSETLSDNLKRLRGDRTQTWLATSSGVAVRTIIGIEKKEGPSPTLNTLAALAGALKVPVTALITPVDVIKPAENDTALREIIRALADAPPDFLEEVRSYIVVRPMPQLPPADRENSDSD